MHLRGWTTCVALLLTVLLLSCGRSTREQGAQDRSVPEGRPAQPAAGLPDLPRPSQLIAAAGQADARTVSAIPADLRKSGGDFKNTLPLAGVTAPNASSPATFAPAWEPGAPSLTGLSFAMYDYTIEGYTGDPSFNTEWTQAPIAGRAFIGLAHWDNDTWDWFAADPLKTVVPSLDPYVAFGGKLLLVLVVTGETKLVLQSIRIGSQAPEVSIEPAGVVAVAPVQVEWTADATDVDGTVVDYRWARGDDTAPFDLGDGSPELTLLYEQPLSELVLVRAFDNDGVFGESSEPIDIKAPFNFTVGNVNHNEAINTATIDGNGNIVFYGTSGVAPGIQTAIACFADGSSTPIIKVWQGGGNDQLLDAIPGLGISADVVCGFTDSVGAGGFDGLLQFWDQGTVTQSFAIGSADHDEFFRSMGHGSIDGTYMMAGNSESLADNQSSGLLVGYSTVTDSVAFANTFSAPGDCKLTDMVVTPANIHVCGLYEPAPGDVGVFYAKLDTFGSVVSAQLLNDPATDEEGVALHVDAAGDAWVTGLATLANDDRVAFLSLVGGSTVLVTVDDAVQTRVADIVATAGAPLSLLLRRRVTLQESTIVVADFDSELQLTGSFELGAPSPGDSAPRRALRYGVNGLLLVGQQTGERPSIAAPGVTVTPSAMAWASLSMTSGIAPFVLTPTLTNTGTLTNPEYNSGGTDGNAAAVLLVHAPPI